MLYEVSKKERKENMLYKEDTKKKDEMPYVVSEKRKKSIYAL